MASGSPACDLMIYHSESPVNPEDTVEGGVKTRTDFECAVIDDVDSEERLLIRQDTPGIWISLPDGKGGELPGVM